MGFGTVAGCKVVVTKTGDDKNGDVVYKFSENDAEKLASRMKALGIVPIQNKESFSISKKTLTAKIEKPPSPAAILLEALEQVANITVITLN